MSSRSAAGSRAPRLRPVLLGVSGIVMWLAIWQYFVTAGPLRDTAGLASASATLDRAGELATDQSFWGVIGENLLMAASGTLIALVIGTVLGLGMGLQPLVAAVFDSLVQVLKPIPPVVLLPIALLALGPTRNLGILLAAIAALWPILIQVQAGARDVDPVALDTAQALRLGVVRTQLSVVLPSVVPYLLSGLRIGSATALMMSVGAGLLAGAPGLGQLILLAQQSGQGATVFAGILWAGALGIVLSFALALAQRVATHDNWGRGAHS